MTSDKLADVFSGGADRERADLHAALDLLLDAVSDDGRLDAPAFWCFCSSLAEGRGIADELEAAAASLIAKDDVPDTAEGLWRAMQFATLYHLLRRLSAFGSAVLPESFSASAWLAVTASSVNPNPGIYADLLGLGTTRGGDGALFRAARRQLVMAVYYRAAKDDLNLSEARDIVFPPAGRGKSFHRTWQGWQREVAAAKGVTIDQLCEDAGAAARGEKHRTVYEPDTDLISCLWQFGYRPR